MLILLVSLPALAEIPGLYKNTRKPVPAAFFDVKRAKVFWNQENTLEDLEKAYERCVESPSFAYWNRVWVDTERAINYMQLSKLFDSEVEGSRARLTLDQVLAKYGKDGAALVHSDLETVKYCHDLSRTFEEWRYAFANAVKDPAKRGFYNSYRSPAYEEVRVPYNEWGLNTCEALSRHNDMFISTDHCALPDWRTPEEVANYDTALLNNVIRQQNEVTKNAQSSAQSRQVIEAYLSDHGATMSDTDRKALEIMLKQLN